MKCDGHFIERYFKQNHVRGGFEFVDNIQNEPPNEKALSLGSRLVSGRHSVDVMLSAEVVHFNKLRVNGIKSHILIFALRLHCSR